MPQVEAKFQINDFSGGLNTDSNPLADPGPITTNEDNCEILPHKGRRRRRGLQLESGFQLHTTTLLANEITDWAFGTFEWEAVAGIVGLEFLVFQQGPILWFYDKASSALSSGLKSFNIDLRTHKIANTTDAQVETTLVATAAGKGVLFVCGSFIDPFFVEYDSVSDTISTSTITIEIRDFEEQSPTIGLQQELLPPVTGQHLYDLLNQGWYQPNLRVEIEGTGVDKTGDPAIILYTRDTPNTQGKLPKKNTQWHVGKQIVVEGKKTRNFLNPHQVRSTPTGNTLAPLGHYILNAFRKDRAAAVTSENTNFISLLSTLGPFSTLPLEIEDKRPNAVAFFAGRVWYLLNDTLFFSQVLDKTTLNRAGRCYQAGDPTDEGTSDVVDTDGGTVRVAGMGVGTSLAVIEDALLVFADNGIWTVGGPEGSGFKPTDFSVTKIASFGTEAPSSVVEAEGVVFFWNDFGIHVIRPGDIRNIPTIENIIENRIVDFYNNIPENSRLHAKGVYDPKNKQLSWLYASVVDAGGPSKNRFKYDRILNFSLRFNAFTPWSIDVTANHQMAGCTISPGIAVQFQEQNVTDNALNPITTTGGGNVTVNVQTTVESAAAVKILVFKSNQATFAEFKNLAFVDWDDVGTGVDYSSFLETFYHKQDDFMTFMQAPYIYTYFRKTEEESLPSGVLESSCLLNTRWDWANLTASGKISPDIQVYRGDRIHLVTDPNNPEATGLPVLFSKSKTRGRGRALQLRYRSESGKDFELYGWAVWSAKNTRF